MLVLVPCIDNTEILTMKNLTFISPSNRAAAPARQLQYCLIINALCHVIDLEVGFIILDGADYRGPEATAGEHFHLFILVQLVLLRAGGPAELTSRITGHCMYSSKHLGNFWKHLETFDKYM